MKGFTKSQLASLARALGKRHGVLSSEIRAELLRSGDQRHIDLAGQVHDRGEEAVANELADLEHVLGERHLRELREVEAARSRLAAGSIDHCADCGESIGFERLMANPVAVR